MLVHFAEWWSSEHLCKHRKRVLFLSCSNAFMMCWLRLMLSCAFAYILHMLMWQMCCTIFMFTLMLFFHEGSTCALHIVHLWHYISYLLVMSTFLCFLCWDKRRAWSSSGQQVGVSPICVCVSVCVHTCIESIDEYRVSYTDLSLFLSFCLRLFFFLVTCVGPWI